MLKAHCIAQEYWYINQKSGCECGGDWKVLQQNLMEDERVGEVDSIDVVCEQCGRQNTISFDITPFYGHTGRDMDLFANPDTKAFINQNENLKDFIGESSKPLMDRAISYIVELAENGDIFTLDFLKDVIFSCMDRVINPEENEEKRKTILLIDDDYSICETISKYIKYLGYDVVISYDGDQGWDKYQAEKPDLVITDINHLGIDGLEVLGRIKISDQSTPVIIITDDNPKKRRRHALKAGADAFLAKPFTWDDLENQIYDLLIK